jgi:bifunctional NMN adenylyltransferase/nudix hydrolase
MTKLGVIIGRFQVPELHNGHKSLIDHAYVNSDKVVIFVGAAPFILTKRNPLPPEAAAQVVREYIKKSHKKNMAVLALPDIKGSDEEWSARLDVMLSSLGYNCEVTLYTDRDGFNPHYKGKYPVVVTDMQLKSRGTDVRANLEPQYDNKDWREGLIWGIENQYPIARVAVDVLMFHNEPNNHDNILVVKKAGEDKWRFPGGMVDPTDTSLEHTVRREVMEECPVSWMGDPEYIFSTAVGDWRGQVLTSVFEVSWDGLNKLSPRDAEIADIEMFRTFAIVDKLVPEHKPIWEKYIERFEYHSRN